MGGEEYSEKRLRALEDGHLLAHRDMREIKESLGALTDSVTKLANIYTEQEIMKTKSDGVDKRLDKLETNQKWFVTSIILLMGAAFIDVIVL